MSPDPGPSTEIRLDTRARRPPPTDQPAHGDAYGMTQATAASLTILRHPLPAARSFVLALLRALHLAPRLRSAEPSQQRRAADRPNFPLTRGPLTDKERPSMAIDRAVTRGRPDQALQPAVGGATCRASPSRRAVVAGDRSGRVLPADVGWKASDRADTDASATMRVVAADLGGRSGPCTPMARPWLANQAEGEPSDQVALEGEGQSDHGDGGKDDDRSDCPKLDVVALHKGRDDKGKGGYALLAQDDRIDKFIPGEEDREEGRHHHASPHLWYGDLPQRPQARGPEHERRLLGRPRQLLEESLHDPGHERHVEHRVRDDECNVRVDQVDHAPEKEERDDDRHLRHEQHAQDEERKVPPPDTEPGDRVAGRHAQRYRYRRRCQRDDRAVDQAGRPVPLEQRVREVGPAPVGRPHHRWGGLLVTRVFESRQQGPVEREERRVGKECRS